MSAVKDIVNAITEKLYTQMAYSETKADLATLRRATARPATENLPALLVLYENMDDIPNTEVTAQDEATVYSLALFAQAQHGNKAYVQGNCSVGALVGALYKLSPASKQDKKDKKDKSAQALRVIETKKDMRHVALAIQRLIGMAQQEHRGVNVRLDYGRLAEELYLMQRSRQDKVRILGRWVKDAYKYGGGK